MKAFRITSQGETGLMDVESPSPGLTEVGIRVGSASFCHSDIELSNLPSNVPGIPVPVTLGHELAGWIDQVGQHVKGWRVGDAVAVYIIEGCGQCPACQRGVDNLCENGVIRTPGVHYDGGLAERVVIDAARLVPLDGVDMAAAAPLTDAGITAYHAVELTRLFLRPGSTVLVSGIGGLGHLGLQIVLATSAAEVIAVDVDEPKLDLAKRLGAHAAVLAGPEAASAVLEANRGRKVDVVLDFAGVQETVDLGVDTIRRGGMMVVAGMGGGEVPLISGFGGPARRVPSETTVVASFAGNRQDLYDVLALARQGLVTVEATHYSLTDAPRAWADFGANRLVGRAVINP